MLTILQEFLPGFIGLLAEFTVPVLLLTVGFIRFDGAGTDTEYAHGMSNRQVFKVNVFLGIITFLVVFQTGIDIFIFSEGIRGDIISFLTGGAYLSLATLAYININFSPKLIK